MDDLISRQAALDIFDDYNVSVENGELEAYSRDRKRLCDLPPIQPVVTDKNVGDTISRQAALDALSLDREILSRVLDDRDVVGVDREKYSYGLKLIESNIEDIKELPPAQPEPTDEQVAEYCKRRCLHVVTDDFFHTVQPEPQWISVTERLPDNADHPGAFCPRYQVVTPYGVTEGWYRPHDHEKGGQWFALFWFMSQIYEIWNIDFERGDVPKVIGEAPVMEWRPLPEPYKPNNK